MRSGRMVPFMAYTRERGESEIEREIMEGFNRQFREAYAKHGMKGVIIALILDLLLIGAVTALLFLATVALIRLIFG